MTPRYVPASANFSDKGGQGNGIVYGVTSTIVCCYQITISLPVACKQNPQSVGIAEPSSNSIDPSEIHRYIQDKRCIKLLTWWTTGTEKLNNVLSAR